MKDDFPTKKRLIRFAYTTGLLGLLLAVALNLSAIGIFAANLAQIAPNLGNAESFAVLGGTTVTNTGSSIVNGDLGLSPGTSVTGFPPGIVNGTIHISDTAAQNAQTDVTTAYNTLVGQACDQNLTGQDLGGLTLTPGIYCFDTSAQLTGTLTLDAQGDEFSVFIFQIGSTLTTASGSSVNIINGENLCNLFWQVGSSATLGTTTAFKGNILALASITLNTGAAINGRSLARNGAVSLDTNTITIPVCSVADEPTPTNTPDTPTPTATQTLQVATQTAIAATQTAIATLPAPTQTAIVATQTAIALLPAATQTAIATQTLQAATQTAQAATQTAQATENVLNPTTTPILPDTGGDLAPGPQTLRVILGGLGLTLILYGFMISRRTQETDR